MQDTPSELDPPSHRSSLGRGLVAVAALLVLVGGAGVAGWILGSRPGHRLAVGVSPGSYFIAFPQQADRGGGAFSAQVTATTNLPDGTLVAIDTTDEGTCCPAAKDGTITVTTQDSSCYGFVGAAEGSPEFSVTITAKPDFRPWIVPGPVSNPKPPQQPANVLATLGSHFENLTGDQAVDQPDDSKWLVGTAELPWPEPRCGGDPIPLFGGPSCDPTDFQQQLQGNTLEEAMVDVMGALGQGRMCEFWSVNTVPFWGVVDWTLR